MKKVLVVLGSARPGRAADNVAKIVSEELTKLNIEPVIADLKEIDLPFFNDALTPSDDNFEIHNESAKKWSQMVKDSNGVVFLTPEYNHGTSAILKNAIDWLYAEWENKPTALVGYGWSGAPFSIAGLSETLRHIKSNFQPSTAGLSFTKSIELDGSGKNTEAHEIVRPTLEELVKALG